MYAQATRSSSRRLLSSVRRLNNASRSSHSTPAASSSHLSTHRTLASDAYTKSTDPDAPSVSTTPNITPEQRSALDAALRVDQAGEIAANWIYMGQYAVFSRDKNTRELIKVRCPNHADIFPLYTLKAHSFLPCKPIAPCAPLLLSHTPPFLPYFHTYSSPPSREPQLPSLIA